jgi:hypothetical protein
MALDICNKSEHGFVRPQKQRREASRYLIRGGFSGSAEVGAPLHHREWSRVGGVPLGRDMRSNAALWVFGAVDEKYREHYCDEWPSPSS